MTNPCTNLVLLNHDDAGRVHAAWTNPASLDQITVNMRPSGATTWEQEYAGAPITGITLLPCPTVPTDYQVIASLAGVPATPLEQDGFLLGLRAGMYGVWLDDVLDPTLSVCLGAVEDFKTLKWTSKFQVDSFIPLGGRYPRDYPGLANYLRQNGPPAYTVWATDTLTDGTLVNNHQLMATLRQMAPPRFVTTLYRDPSGRRMYVKIVDYYDEPMEDINWTVYPTLETRQPPAAPLAIPG